MSTNSSAQTRAHSANHTPAAPILAEALKSLLVDWFPVRDRLCDLRSKDDQTDPEAEEVYQRLSELVDIADDIVAQLVPDVHARVGYHRRNPPLTRRRERRGNPPWPPTHTATTTSSPMPERR